MKSKRSASSTVSLLNGDSRETDVKDKKVKEDNSRKNYIIDECGYCGLKKEVSLVECDSNWSLHGESEHLDRVVCKDCRDRAVHRILRCTTVVKSMRKQLAKKGLDSFDIEHAVSLASKAFIYILDDRALEEWEKKTSGKPKASVKTSDKSKASKKTHSRKSN